MQKKIVSLGHLLQLNVLEDCVRKTKSPSSSKEF